MRIIAGKYKGRKIVFPESKLVRPTTDRNKESIFNYLFNQIPFDEIDVCDIYAGSGSLGLEALSRGAGNIDFVEKNFHVYKVLQKNISSLDADKYCNIFKMPAVKFTKMAAHKSYDLIIADPPFFKDDIHEAVKNLLERNYLNMDGLLIIERSIQTQKKDIEEFRIEPVKRLGDSLIYRIDSNHELN
ncbi:MAG: 16S rRNA (guanine(966)-N(2))-methyltransferase RsmD [Melioribacteraceae bacterium]|nr:16S rRNA (guanine(966)-N(2))-methyltransferase RsmD [Melioribacteraceae bacterium]MCF8353343.1 16S rRNA (guanine(966)-N(2))-methyltransferase RsmD [Melioribacteraceae bacterium]MCF8393207.1 16S rRNA (guanine(966)-N(2))-methyltransferase RsmD [Melioribacteraceae bacterium]MCF8419069.1 16S rRNA (guanine(966)-N(2))-methyltransferase RsmD [Melioribacteraceae bacterium]